MKQPTIFIVDDEPMNLSVLFEHARRASWRVLIHTSGASALKAIPGVNPDIVLLDIMMPDMDGFEVCRCLKANPATCDIPVIFVTALTDQCNEVNGLELGAVDYIQKPIRAETAIARIRAHLALRQMQQELEAQNLRLQQEIAERQGAEEALAKERNLLQTVLDYLPDFIYVKDREGRFLLNNPAHLRIMGARAQAEALGKTDTDYFPPEIAAQFEADNRTALEGEAIVNREEVVFDAQGEPIWLLTTKAPIRDAQGTIIGLVGISRNITTLKQQADRLRKYERIVSATPDFIALIDRDFRYRILNTAYLKAYEQRAEDILGHAVSEFIGVETFETQVRPYYERCFAGETVNYDIWFSFAKLGRRFLNITLSPYLEIDGAISGAALSARDLTPLKEAQAALEESERRYRQLVETSPDGIILHQQGRVVYMNAAGRAMLGLAEDESVIGMPLLEFIHPDFHAIAQDRIRRNDEEQQVTGFMEMQFLRQDGLAMTVELAGTPTTYQGQIAMQTVFRDMTERKEMEDALAEERNLLRTLINTLPEHIYIKDIHSRFLLANNAALQSLGFQALDDLIGKTDFDVFPYEIAARHYTNEAALFVSGAPIVNHEEMNLFHERDGMSWYQATKVPFRDLHGDIAGLVGINHDISEMKRAEERLRAAHQELQEKNAQLYELNASKDKFFSIIAHDLRAPFNTLLGFANLLLERIETSSRDMLKSHIETLLVSAQRLFALLENLLTWSRVQRGLIQYEPQPLDLRYLAASAIDALCSTAEQKQISLKNEVIERLWVEADYYMTTTVMRNLLSNALKFTPAGGAVVMTACEREREVEVSVSDTGVGMTPEVLASLFRIDAHHTTAGTAGEYGSGLGLILCHDLVKKNGGTIRVESTAGNGTIFRFTLPRYIVPEHVAR